MHDGRLTQAELDTLDQKLKQLFMTLTPAQRAFLSDLLVRAYLGERDGVLGEHPPAKWHPKYRSSEGC